jgi:hypothetical protein
MSGRRAALAALVACGIPACNAIFGVDAFVVSTGGAATTSGTGGSTGGHPLGGSDGGATSTTSTTSTGTGGSCPACDSGVCGTTISASMATAPTRWSFNGSATYDAAAMTGTLTALANDVGTIVYEDALETDTFVVTFDFQIVGTLGEGMAFMIEQTGVTAVGTGGGGLGVTGLTGYAFEIDTHKSNCGDPDANHVGVDSLTPCSTSGPPTALTVSVNPPYTLAGSGWHTCEVDFMNGTVTMKLSGTDVITSYVIPGWSSGQAYYFGFAGDSGTKGATHQIRNVTLAFPTPRCL